MTSLLFVGNQETSLGNMGYEKGRIFEALTRWKCISNVRET